MQIEYRSDSPSGLQFSGSYTFGQAYVSNRYSFRTPRVSVLQTGTDGNVIHAVKGNWVFELPFGRGRRFAQNTNGVVDHIISGWEFDGVGRIQTGELLDFGNVRVVGMTKDEFQKSVEPARSIPNGQVYILPADIIANTIKAFNVSATDAERLRRRRGADRPLPRARKRSGLHRDRQRHGRRRRQPVPISVEATARAASTTWSSPDRRSCNFDLSAVKRFTIIGHTNVEFRAEMLNAFNTPYFTPRAAIGTTDSSYRLQTTTGTPRVVQLVFRVNF